MLNRFRLGVCLVLVVGLLSGCVGSGGSAGVSDGASSPVAVSPSADASAELYAEAERIYREFDGEIQKLAKAGGADELPAAFVPLLNDFMQEVVTNLARKMKKSGLRIGLGQEVLLSEIKPLLTISWPNSVLALQMCTDGRQLHLVDAKGADAGFGKLMWNATFFEHVDGVLKISGSKTEEVSSCVFK